MENWVRELFKKGTPQCGLAYGVLAFVLGLLLIIFGIWKTLLVVLICAVAVFVGGKKNYEQGIKNFINKVVPKEKVLTAKDFDDGNLAQQGQKAKPSKDEEHKTPLE